MNEFAAGSAVITHGSAGSGSTGLYQKTREVTGETPVFEMMCLLSWEARARYVIPDQPCCRYDNWLNVDALCHWDKQ